MIVTKEKVNTIRRYRLFDDPVLCCWFFSVLFFCLCLLGTYLSYQTYRVGNVKDHVERMSLDLLGFIEFDQEKQFLIRDDVRPEANKYFYHIVGARGNQGLAYIWSETEDTVVWPLDEQWSEQPAGKRDQLAALKAQHVTLIRQHLKNNGLYNGSDEFKLSNAVSVGLDGQYHEQARYMTSGQLFQLDTAMDGELKPAKYLYVVAKSMQAVENDLTFLSGLGWRFLLLLNVLFALDWLICRFVIKPVRSTS